MHYHLLNQIGRAQLPVFVSDPQQVKMIKRQQRAGYGKGRLYPEAAGANQFAQVDGVTPLGERVRTIFANAGMQSEADGRRLGVRLSSDVQQWSFL